MQVEALRLISTVDSMEAIRLAKIHRDLCTFFNSSSLELQRMNTVKTYSPRLQYPEDENNDHCALSLSTPSPRAQLPEKPRNLIDIQIQSYKCYMARRNSMATFSITQSGRYSDGDSHTTVCAEIDYCMQSDNDHDDDNVPNSNRSLYSPSDTIDGIPKHLQNVLGIYQQAV